MKRMIHICLSGGLLLLVCLHAQELIDLENPVYFLINDDTTGGTEQTSSCLGADSSGVVTLVWEDGREGDRNIYFQRFDTLLNEISEPVRVNDDPGFSDQARPVIAVHPAGSGLITWEDQRENGPQIYMQIIDSKGRFVGVNQRVNREESYPDFIHKDPVVIFSEDPMFHVAWSDNRTGTMQIAIQSFDSLGNAVGNNIGLSRDVLSGAQNRCPSLAVWREDTLIAAWQSTRDNTTDVYIRKISLNPPEFETPVLIANNGYYPRISVQDDFIALVFQKSNMEINVCLMNGQLQLKSPSLTQSSVSPNGQASSLSLLNVLSYHVIIWESRENDDVSLYFREFGFSGWINEHIRLSMSDRFGSQNAPCAVSLNENVIIAWEDHALHHSDLGLAVLNAGQPETLTSQWIQPDEGTSDQTAPGIAMNSEGKWIAVWEDLRDGYQDIYCQLYDEESQPVGVNVRVNSNTGPRHQVNPDVDINASGDFVVVWRSDQSDQASVYAQRFNGCAEPVGGNLMITDSPTSTSQNEPQVALENNGSYLVVWRSSPNQGDDIMGQYVNAQNIKSGDNQIINDDLNQSDQNAPAVSSDGDGRFVVVWEDNRNGSMDVYGQILNSGIKAGANFSVHGNIDLYQGDPSVDMNPLGQFVAAWHDNRDQIARIYLQKIDADMTKDGPEISLESKPGAIQKEPHLSFSAAGWIAVSWLDYTLGAQCPVLHCQWIPPSGDPGGSEWAWEQTYTADADVVMNDHQTLFVIQENQRHYGWDISGIRLNHQMNQIRNNDINPLPDDFGILSAYPNPFNHQVRIIIKLPKETASGIQILNLKGESVFEFKFSGRTDIHRIFTWDGKASDGTWLPSGLYFIRLHTCSEFDQCKLILMK
ncbi:hypothetical protein JW835_09290 [bacterium]|nr:hypothetical protein [bacterium]